MANHSVRIFHSERGADSFHGWLDQWLTNMAPWESGGHENELPTLVEQDDTEGVAFYLGDLRFDWSEDKAHILDDLDQYAAAYCDWHLIGYHVCEWGEDSPDACGWETTRDNGDVPDSLEGRL